MSEPAGGQGTHQGSGLIDHTRQPTKAVVVSLLDKPSRREVPIRATWTGFEIPDEFVVGYGIDFAQRDRNLPHIGKVRFTERAAG